MSRFLPRSLTAQLLLLLTAALLAAGLSTLFLLGGERREAVRGARRLAELERLAALVPALSLLDDARRDRIAAASSRRVMRVRIGQRPLVDDEPRMFRLERRFMEEVGDEAREVRIATRPPRNAPRREWRRHAMMDVIVSVQLPDGIWLNAEIRPARPPSGMVGIAVVASLGVALVFVLGVAFLFLRRITVPIARLTAAIGQAGEGDRSATAPVSGSSETREAAIAFNAMQRDIARLETERARTVAAVGHDLRTPITSLRIRAEMLDEETAAPMVRTLDEMRVMADGLLEWGRNASESEPPANVDIAAILREIAAEHEAAYEGPPDALFVPGRPVALRRAYANLVDNARRYGGEAVIRLATEPGRVRIAVLDEGSGIPDALMEEMLEPFVRGEASRSRETGGAGLGLSIARGILAAHGGTLELRNREGGGLAVETTLPRGDTEPV